MLEVWGSVGGMRSTVLVISSRLYGDPEAWAAELDPNSKVGSRHHVVPRFILEKWADSAGQVQVRSKAGDRTYQQQVTDLGVTDFYTAVSISGELDASMEDLLAEIEGASSAVIRELMNPFAPLRQLGDDQTAKLANFVAFQMVRGPRRRREIEIQADWFAKTMTADDLRKQLGGEDLRENEFVPHQNDHIKMMGGIAEQIALRIISRPVALLTIDRPLFFIGDEPVIVNIDGDHIEHHPDCFMTDEEYEAMFQRESRRNSRRRRQVSRVVHMAPTQPRGIEGAVEVVMPISPRTLLIWGSEVKEWAGVIERIRCDGGEADEIAEQVNSHQVEWSLDTIVSRIGDERLNTLRLPEPKPLLIVCDRSGPAKDAVNRVPTRIRPRRLDKSAETLAQAAKRGKE